MKQAKMTFEYDGYKYEIVSNHLPTKESAIIFLMEARREVETELQKELP